MIIYHTGLLMRDRLTDPLVDDRARKAWSLHECGSAVLLQRRVREGVCEYIAIPVEPHGRM
jgi:hypothetical protein